MHYHLGAMRLPSPSVPGETSLVDHVTLADNSLASTTMAVSVDTHPEKRSVFIGVRVEVKTADVMCENQVGAIT